MNALRLAVGTLTVLPVRAPVVDRLTAGRAMMLAPLVALLLAVPVVLVLDVAGDAGASPLLSSTLAIGTLALATRALHLDGLADTADGLGSGKPGDEAVQVMRRGDVGPFGVVTLVLVLLLQVAALSDVMAEVGVVGLVVALVVSRLALPLACLHGVPAARGEGLGAAVAGSVSKPMALLAVLLAYAVLAPLALATPGGNEGLRLLAVAPLGLLAGLVVVVRAVRRLGGVTGDVLGAAVETTFAATLVLLALP